MGCKLPKEERSPHCLSVRSCIHANKDGTFYICGNWTLEGEAEKSRQELKEVLSYYGGFDDGEAIQIIHKYKTVLKELDEWLTDTPSSHTYYEYDCGLGDTLDKINQLIKKHGLGKEDDE